MADLESCSRIEQRSVIKFLVADSANQVNYSEECLLCMKKHVSAKNVYKWAKLFKEGRKNVFDEDRPGIPTRVRTPTMIKSVDDTTPFSRTEG